MREASTNSDSLRPAGTAAAGAPGLDGAAQDTLQHIAEKPFEPPSPSGDLQWKGFPWPTFALTALFVCFTFIPPASGNARLTWSLLGVAGALLIWQFVLWIVASRRGMPLKVEFFAVKAHYVQACVQSTILIYWGWYWHQVYAEVPLILSQLIFLYCLDALFSWSRGRTWRLGFGPMPIVISTNLLLWFHHDWYFLQYAMLTVGALGKQFITWERDGRRTHIFNPSAFGQSVFAIGLIATGTTSLLTAGQLIAQTFETPHMLIVIFLGGLVVQYLFHVTLMTVAATATICVFGLLYAQITGVYFFVNINIAAPIFLGLHLLVTDPATSPRTNLGRVIYGALYGIGYLVLFRVLDLMEVPLFWDKLLPVPILNLCVPLIDRLVRMGVAGKLNRLWENALQPRMMNLVHMACWVLLFITMFFTGFIEAPHPGNSVAFWKQALADGKPHAGHSLVLAAGALAEGSQSGAAYNELGLICMEGKIVRQNNALAAKYFATACELEDMNGCVNVAIQFLFLGERRSDEDVAAALERLEDKCAADPDWLSCYLVAMAYENGRGRPLDRDRAVELYQRCGAGNLYALKGFARIGLTDSSHSDLLTTLPSALARACERGDVESCWYLAYMHHTGQGVDKDDSLVRYILEWACQNGMDDACAAIEFETLPAYRNPVMLVPSWSTAYPIP